MTKRPKVITLEKAPDGTYVAPKDAVVEEYVEKQVVEQAEPDYSQFERTVVMDRRRENIHRFIVRHGTNTAEFLDGVTKAIKAYRALQKLIK